MTDQRQLTEAEFKRLANLLTHWEAARNRAADALRTADKTAVNAIQAAQAEAEQVMANIQALLGLPRPPRPGA